MIIRFEDYRKKPKEPRKPKYPSSWVYIKNYESTLEELAGSAKGGPCLYIVRP